MFSKTYSLNSLSETQLLGEKIARLLRPQDVIFLKGELGAGKTTLARSIITALNPHIISVPSPTFSLVQIYEISQGNLWHFDLYRIKHIEEVFELAIEEAFSSGISLIEWPERLEGLRLPSSLLEVTLENVQQTEKRIAKLVFSLSWKQKWKP
jgi:tRNA threonylcarbamoyladenosine biosynthesis protein TsaE